MDKVFQNITDMDPDGLQMLVVGYGTTQAMLFPDWALLEAYRRYGWVTFSDLKDKVITTYQDDSLDNARTCKADSGGPLFYVDENGEKVLVGLLTRSSGDLNNIYKCEIGRMLHYRLDTAEAQDFISDYWPED
jgi:hypothetical protein